MSEELQQKVEALLKKNSQLIADADVNRTRVREDAKRAQKSLLRAKAALRRSGVRTRSAAA